MALFVLLSSVFVAFSFVLADQDGRSNGYLKEKTESPQWSAKLLGRYEFGVNQVFESVLDGAVSITHDSYLIGRKANVQVEPNYDQVTYRELRFDILYDAPFLNIINETEFNGSTDHRSFSAGCSPRLLGLSSAGPSVIVYVVCIEAGHCESYHELKVALFSTSYCEPGKGTWCENPIGPLTLTTDVPCSEKLPRMAFAPLDTDVMILLDSYPESEFLSCIFVQNGQSPCRLGGGLPKNRLDIQYFYNVSTQETLMQVKAEGSSDSYSQYMIDRFGSIRKLYSSDNTEQNPPCPMLSPSVFNCTSGLKFMNGSLVHLTDAIGEPQGFQSSFGTKGVAYMKLTGKETAVVVLRPSLDGGSQVLDNSSWICSNNIRVKPIYVLNNGAVIVITRCFPDGDSIFQVYLYNVTVAHYALVPSHHAMHLGSGQFGRILNVHVIGQLFLVEGANVPLVPTVLPPGSPTAVTVTPSMNESTIIIIAIVILGLAATVVAAVVIVTYVCHQRKGRKWRSCFTQCHGIDNGDRQSLLGRGDNDVEDGHNRDDDKRSLEGDLGGQEVVRPGSPGKDDEQAQEQDNKQTDENIDASRQQGAEAAIGDELQIGDTMELTHGTAAMGQAPKPPPVVSEIQRTVPPDEDLTEVLRVDLKFELPSLHNADQEQDPNDSHTGSKTLVPSCMTSGPNATTQVVLSGLIPPDAQNQGKSSGNGAEQEIISRDLMFSTQEDIVDVLSEWKQPNMRSTGHLCLRRTQSLPCYFNASELEKGRSFAEDRSQAPTSSTSGISDDLPMPQEETGSPHEQTTPSTLRPIPYGCEGTT